MNIEKLRPKDFSWTSLNVMPFMDIKNLPANKKIIAITDDTKNNIFSDWKLFATVRDKKIYIRDSQ